MTESEREQRIREKAYQLWIEEGSPEGRADAHWDMATELVAIEENQLLTLKPVENFSSVSPAGEPVEPLLAVENAGEFPTLTDQGEEKAYPAPVTAELDRAAELAASESSAEKTTGAKRSRKKAG